MKCTRDNVAGAFVIITLILSAVAFRKTPAPYGVVGIRHAKCPDVSSAWALDTIPASVPHADITPIDNRTEGPGPTLPPGSIAASVSTSADTKETNPAKGVKLMENLDQLPLIFIENQGQLDEQVIYYVHGRDKSIYFTSRGLTYALTNADTGGRWTVRLDFLGTDPNLRPVGEERAGTTISYFRGPPKEWHTHLPTQRRIVYEDLWPGIDLAYFGTSDRLKYEFVVHPGADPSDIRLAYRGAELTANADGDLKVTTPSGGFVDQAPVAYQDLVGHRLPVTADFELTDQSFSFKLGDFDPDRQLVIDPAVIVYCGFVGGSNDEVVGLTVDTEGNAYIVGSTESSASEDFPISVGPDQTFNGAEDVFVAKVSADGTALEYCGYIGGTAIESASDISVDAEGNAYVVGTTTSTPSDGFPVVGGPDTTFNGVEDAFVAKVRSDGSALDYCGYIGGTEQDSGSGIAVDAAGSAYLSGSTSSSQFAGFPVVVGPDLTFNGDADAFVAKIQADGRSFDYCGYVGGSDSDSAMGGIALDPTGNAYVAGFTRSSESESFPVLVGPDVSHNGGNDGFVAKVTADGSRLDYCGYIGGAGADAVSGIDVDETGSAYVVGRTLSDKSTFPVAVGPYLSHGGRIDAFIAKIRHDGSSLVYCGYIGGANSDEGRDVVVDGNGNAFLVGTTSSTQSDGFPVFGGPDDVHNGQRDAFVAGVLADGSALHHCGFIGGAEDDYGTRLGLDGNGGVYVGGFTNSSESEGFPVVSGPDITFNGGSDGFVAKLIIADQGFRISGEIKHADVTPLEGLAVSAGGGRQVSTGVDGEYSIGPLITGTYTVVPTSTNNWVFVPPTRTVRLPPDATNQDFTAYQAVEACFSAAPTSGLAPLTVEYTNLSAGDYLSSTWRLSEGVTSTVTHPTHTYSAPGPYTTTLKVSGPGGTDVLARRGFITVYGSAEAAFTAHPTSGPIPLTVSFENQSSGGGLDNLWFFGDGVTSMLEAPTHTYTSIGLYTVTLGVQGPGDQDSHTKAAYITVEPVRTYLPAIMVATADIGSAIRAGYRPESVKKVANDCLVSRQSSESNK